MKKRVALLAASALLFCSCGASGVGRAEAVAVPAVSPSPTSEPQPQTKTIELSFTASGDNLIHDGIYSQAARRTQGNGYDFAPCYADVRDFYAQHDINWINQETLVNNEIPPSTYPCFSTPGEMGHTLYDVGFRVFNLSNNHVYDQGAAGLAATHRFWSEMPDDALTCGLYAGADDDGIVLQTVQGVTIAYLGYTEHTNGIPTPVGAEWNVVYTKELDKLQTQIEKAAALADVVVVSNHWGVEGSHSVTDTQRALAQKQAEWGADVIIGTGPHVVQSAEWLDTPDGRKTFVAYSLGNFISAQSSADTMIGAVLELQIHQTVEPDGTKDTKILSPILHPTVTHYGTNYSNIHLYWYKDYTEELASQHGVHVNAPGFSMDYIRSVIADNIPEEFLAME